MPLSYPDDKSIVDLYTAGIQAMFELTGGQIRGKKGALAERIAEAIVRLAWRELGAEEDRLTVKKQTQPIYIDENYVKTLKHGYLRHDIRQNKDKYIYEIEFDRAVEIDNRFVLGVECKAFTDQTMFKRSLKEFELTLHLLFPELLFCIFQLENGLGGDYGDVSNPKQLGSGSTHTLISHSPTESLEIITLLDGNHNPNKKIHTREHFKNLPTKNVAVCVSKFRDMLADFV